VLEWELPDAQWFVDGKTNICHNCVDRQVLQRPRRRRRASSGKASRNRRSAAMPAPPRRARAEAAGGGPPRDPPPQLSRAAARDVRSSPNVLKSLGVGKGDVVTIYMGMVPEIAIAMLACARIGAAHSVIFRRLRRDAIVDRVSDAGSRVIITCDGAWRRGQVVPLKDNVDPHANSSRRTARCRARRRRCAASATP
jgi:acetyl-CoA synthetase